VDIRDVLKDVPPAQPVATATKPVGQSIDFGKLLPALLLCLVIGIAAGRYSQPAPTPDPQPGPSPAPQPEPPKPSPWGWTKPSPVVTGGAIVMVAEAQEMPSWLVTLKYDLQAQATAKGVRYVFRDDDLIDPETTAIKAFAAGKGINPPCLVRIDSSGNFVRASQCSADSMNMESLLK